MLVVRGEKNMKIEMLGQKRIPSREGGVEIVVEFADEDIGSNCGKITFLNGEIEEYIDMDGDTDFALEVCGYDKEEYYAMINEE